MEMQTNYILGLSMNCNSFPSIFLRSVDNEKYTSLGVAQYSQNSFHATILNNIRFKDKAEIDKVLYLGRRNGSALFICSYNESEQNIDPKNVFPLAKSFANHDWVFSCSCHLSDNVKQELALETSSLFTPLGIHTEEHIFYWLLEQIYSKNVTNLEDFDNKELRKLFGRINDFGSIDLLLSDGQNLAVYHDQKGNSPFYALQSAPPHEKTDFIFEKMAIEIDALDRNHSLILFTNQEIANTPNRLISLQPGQMILVKHAEIIYDTNIDLKGKKEQREGDEVIFGAEIRDSYKQPAAAPESQVTLNEIYSLPLTIPLSTREGSSPSRFCMYSFNRKERPILYSIVHDTIYEYDSPVYQSKHLFRLQPQHDFRQTVLKYKLTNSVAGKVYNFSGVFGNHSTMFDVTDPYYKMAIRSEAIVSVNETPPQTRDLLYQQSMVPLIWMPWDRIMLQAYLVPPELPESQLFELSEYAMSFVKVNNYRIMNIVNDINNSIYKEYKYVPASTTLSTTPYEVFITRRGVCQDFANLFICLARLLNIPARYRVGYIFTGADYDKRFQSDATHAWVELYLPNIGWLGFDPTNGCSETNMHIKVACGRNYQDATPTSGTIYRGGGKETFSISVQVRKIENYDIQE